MSRVNVILLLVFLVSTLTISAQSKINFLPSGYKSLFDVAKKENKKVMLYFHFDGCSACKMMEDGPFTDKQVSDFFNANFVSLDINTRKGEGVEISKVYDIQVQPAFLFLDTNGNVFHKLIGYYGADTFLIKAKEALDVRSNLYYYKTQYQNQKNDPEFMYNYCYLLRDAYDLDSAMINAYLNTQTNLSSEKNIRFIYEFGLHNYKNTLTDSVLNFMLIGQRSFFKYFDSIRVVSKIAWIISTKINEVSTSQDEALFKKYCQLFKPFVGTKQVYKYYEMDGRLTGILRTDVNTILEAEVDFYRRGTDFEKYNEALKRYMHGIWNDSKELNSFAWYYFERVNDKAKLDKALVCSKRAVELDASAANRDTQLQLEKKIAALGK